jgi:carbon storage regulator
MLIITRRAGESVYIGKDTIVTVLSVHHGVTKFGIDAPKELEIYREEILPEGFLDDDVNGC